MATTYTLIGKQTVGAAGTTSVVFSNIPQTYTDLLVKMSARTNDAGNYNDVDMDFNGESSRQWRGLYAVTTSAASSSSTSFNIIGPANGAGSTASTFSNSETYIPNYTSTGVKSLSSDGVAENVSSSNWNTSFAANTITNSAAVTSITITPFSGNSFQQYSTFYLYGVSNSSTQNASVPYASGGDVITTDGTYWYHAFKYSGTFTPLKNLTCDYLVVAGGGGGYDGGGGAGGFRTSVGGTALSLTANTAYTATVGAGTDYSSTRGNNSSFSTISATGGGKGGNPGQSGGSGGGIGDGGTYGTGNAGGYSPSEGNNGGGGNYGGGGGAGAAGATGDGYGTGGGAGGAGSNALSSWATATGTGVSGYYAGGGGGGGNSAGGAGGAGGGGAGGQGGNTGAAGVANTGGGSGGKWSGGNNPGGSGIVIVRYAV